MATFSPLEIPENSDGWGPCSVPEQFKNMPYQPFNKSDKLGKVADWTGSTYNDRKLAHKYSSHFATGGQYAYIMEEDEGFHVLDSGKMATKAGKNKMRLPQQRGNFRQQRGKPNLQLLAKNRQNRNQANQRGNAKWNRNKGKFDHYKKKRDGSASVEVRPTWNLIEEMDYPRLSKLQLPNIGDSEDLYLAGALEFYDKSYDKTSTKNERKLKRIDRVFHTVTTTDDPIIRELSRQHGTVYATDVIVATLMTATRSVSS